MPMAATMPKMATTIDNSRILNPPGFCRFPMGRILQLIPLLRNIPLTVTVSPDLGDSRIDMVSLQEAGRFSMGEESRNHLIFPRAFLPGLHPKLPL